MEHFAVIQSLCRVGLADGNPKFRQQVERLRDRLEKDNKTREVEVLDRLLNADNRAAKLEPSRVELSRTLVTGEELTATVHPPVDRETSAPLADIILKPDTSGIAPVFDPELGRSFAAIVEEWRRFDDLSRLGVAPSRSCLLFGPPGTGKTLTAYDVARRLGLPIVSARLDGLVSSFLGTTARNIANLFEFANRYRCILLLDEFDALAKLRDDPQEVGEIKRVVNTLIQNLDQRAAIGVTIAITNHEGLLDPAIWRRFEVRIRMPMPDPAQREALLRQFLPPLELSTPLIQLMTWVSEGCTGADLRTMINAVKRHLVLVDGADGGRDIVRALATHGRTNAASARNERFELLRADAKHVAQTLYADSQVRFTQSAIAEIVGRDQTTVSRWCQEREAQG